MPHKNLFIIRHGETDQNLANVVQGKGINASLNATGRKQALSFFKTYSKEPIDYIFTSTLRRTQETVSHFIAKGLPWQPMHHLDEIGWGELEGKPAAESREPFYALLAEWKKGHFEAKIPGGEDPLELQQRHQRFIQHYRSLPHKNILICTHGRAMRILLSTMLQTPLTEMDQYSHRNTCVYKLHDNGKKITLVTSNCVEHLGNALV
ncbi:MAG TPA: histidine phosphatase family protein [Chitinophagales bacterium]|nr:histidine phosphatase family protein [Chitinophagales bacterium]